MERERAWGSGNAGSNLRSIEKGLEGYACLSVGLAFSPQTFYQPTLGDVTSDFWLCIPSISAPVGSAGGWLVTRERLHTEASVARGAFVWCLLTAPVPILSLH